MLQEIAKVSQPSDKGRRQWFLDDFFDLIVWHDEEGKISGFQLCYEKGNNNERALTWQRTSGYSHNRIDDGEGRTYRQKMTPILIADGFFENKEIAERFRKESKETGAGIAQFIYEKLLQFPDTDNKS